MATVSPYQILRLCEWCVLEEPLVTAVSDTLKSISKSYSVWHRGENQVAGSKKVALCNSSTSARVHPHKYVCGFLFWNSLVTDPGASVTKHLSYFASINIFWLSYFKSGLMTLNSVSTAQKISGLLSAIPYLTSVSKAPLHCVSVSMGSVARQTQGDS